MPRVRSLFLLFTLCLAASAQTGTGSLQGTVTDSSGGVIPNASVSVKGRAVAADAQGRYTLAGLVPGSYTVHAEAPGFTPFDRVGLAIAAGQTASLDISLIVRAQNTEVTVAADAAPVIDTDPSNNAGALVLQKSDLEALPDDPDDLTADLQALAGPAAGPDGAQFFIDGFTGGRMPPKQSIREIRINQNPFAAQFDHPGQGRIEIFTKPGTDEYHGELLFQFNDASLNSRNPFVTTKPPSRRYYWEGEVGGHLGKKTSFSSYFERRDFDENSYVNATVLDAALNVTPFTQAVVTPIAAMDFDIRVDRQLSANHTMTVRFGYEHNRADNAGIGGFSLPERAYRTLDSERTFQFLETAVLNQHTVNEVRFRLRLVPSSNSITGSAPALNVMDAFTSGGASVGNSFDNRTYREVQNFTSWIHGAHSVRFGGVARINSLHNQSKNNYNGTFTFTSLTAYRTTLLGMQQGLSASAIRAIGGGASQFLLTAGDPLINLSQTDVGFFVQDDWRWRERFTLSGGIRYETQTNSGDRSDIAPRLGFAWAIGGGRNQPPKNVIRGGAGLFYDRLPASFSLEAMRQNGVRQQQFLIVNPDFYPSIPTAASLTSSAQRQTIRETDAHWRAPMLIQAGIGFERQLPKHITASVNYLHSNGVRSLRSRNINAPLPGTGVLPYGGVNAIYLYESTGVYRQRQLTANLNARISPKLTFAGSYAFSTAVSNTDGAGTFPANQYDLSQELGPGGFNVRHRVQINGSWLMRYGFRLSPFLTITSGRSYNLTTGRDLNGDGLFTDRPSFATDPSLPGVIRTQYGLLNPTPKAGETIISRNLGIGPGAITANLRFGKAFNVGKHEKGKDSTRQIVLSANARNAINHPNLNTPVGNLSSLLFGQSTGLIGIVGNVTGNRRIDLQIRFNF